MGLSIHNDIYDKWIACRINPPAEQGKLQYNMTRLAMTLNAVDPELLRQLPPTDSRLRPDQRALEVKPLLLQVFSHRQQTPLERPVVQAKELSWNCIKMNA